MTHFRYNDTSKVWERDIAGVWTAVVEHFMGGSVGIGTVAPKGTATKLHVANGLNADTNWNANSVLVVERSGDHCAITIRTPNNKIGYIDFSDPDAAVGGSFQYDHALDRYLFYTAGALRMLMSSLGISVTGEINASGPIRATGGLNTPYILLTLANGENHNVTLSAHSYQRIGGPTAAFAITGCAGGSDGRFLFIINASGGAMTLRHNNANSLASNRLFNLSGADLVTSRAFYVYSAADSLWIQWI